MIKKLLLATCLIATPAAAEVWATGDCTTQSGNSIRYMVHQGKGFITYGDKGPYEMFSNRDTKQGANIGIITHIGSAGNMTLAVDLDTGRGYIITKFDDGRTVEYNVACRLGSTNR